MILLGIETSTSQGTVALCRNGRDLEERTLNHSGRRHAQQLIPEIDRLFNRHHLQPRDCQAVAVSIGPGSFTGLRIGVVCAKTLAYLTGCQLAAVDTFLAVAENSPAEVNELDVIGDARRGQLYVGHYQRSSHGRWQPHSGIEIVTADQWAHDRGPSDVVSGPGLEIWQASLSNRCRVLEEAYRRPRASVVARLGQRQIEQGQSEEPWSLEPRYLRKSAAEEKWNRLHERV